MLVLSFFGIGTGNEAGMAKGEWLDKMSTTLGLEVADGKTSADACLEWGIITEDDMNDLDEAADTAFVFGTLKAAAEKYEEEPIKDLPFSKYMIYFHR